MFVVQCPICFSISCNKTVSNENKYVRDDNSDYIIKKDVKCRWKDNFREFITLAISMNM